jgi:hypothetical protein
LSISIPIIGDLQNDKKKKKTRGHECHQRKKGESIWGMLLVDFNMWICCSQELVISIIYIKFFISKISDPLASFCYDTGNYMLLDIFSSTLS